jgi:class 3 adenylate cyclase
VLAGASTVSALRGAIVARPVGSLPLKGKSDPVEAFELV